MSRLVPALVGGGAVLGTALANGGAFPTEWGWAATLLLLVAVAAVLLSDVFSLSSGETVSVAAVAAYTGWVALSTVWSPSAAQPLLATERDLVYVAGLLALVLTATRRSLQSLLLGVLVAAAAVCAFSLTTYVPGQQLSEPIGYWNSLGLLAVIGILLATGFVLEWRGVRRLLPLVALALLLGTLVLTYSRGAWLALGAGLVAFVVWRSRIRLRYVAVCLLVLVGVAFASGIGQRAYRAFVSPLPSTGGDLSRRLVSLSANGRADYWRVAWRQYEEAPVLGTGAGSFEQHWLEQRPTAFYARNAHNLYLETLAETGPLGLVLLLVALATPLVVAVRTSRPRKSAIAGALGAYVAFLVHAAIDWDWQVTSVTLAALACAAGLLVSSRQERAPHRLDTKRRFAPVAALAGLVAFALVGQVAASALSASSAAATAGRLDRAAADARRAAAWAPWSYEPWQRLGEAELSAGQRRRAETAFREAIKRDRLNWSLWYDLAMATSGSTRTQAIARARRLNPLSLELAPLANPQKE